MTDLTYPNGISGAFSYDASHAVTEWSYSDSDTNLPGRTITRDTMGLKTREDITTGPLPTPATNRRSVNTFDAADRLTSAQVTVGTNTVTETYLYDGCGALTNISQSGASVPLATYGYDLAGRMTSATASNLNLSITYDTFGNRVCTTVNGTNRLWVIDHADPLKRPLMETDTAGNPIRYYIWGARRLLAVIDADGTTRYAHSDDQGSIVALTSTNGAVLFTANYGPYGEPWGTTGTNNTPFGWLGGHGVFHAGNSSLYLTRYRTYDTTLKRFLSSDPLGLGGGANLYAYALGNPLSYIDPLGLGAESSGFASSAVSFASDALFNASDIANAWKLTTGADYSTAQGWAEGTIGVVGMAALTVDAAGNLIPGKAAATTAIKTGVKETAEIITKTLAKEAAVTVAESTSKTGIKSLSEFQLKQALNVGVKESIHPIKEEILSAAGKDALKVVGDNPNIAVDVAGKIILESQENKGVSTTTELLLEWFKQ
jgi:RHS repeat-associated protein